MIGDDLLDAIRAAPADDGPRLVLADRLLEAGDPRGELISVQCLLAAIPDADPRRAELAARERTLLAAHAPPPGTVAVHRRGFVEHATIDAHRARAALAFVAREPLLAELAVKGCGGGGDERWSGIAALIAAVPQLRGLRFEGVIWYWYESSDDGHGNREEIDETAQLSAMLATVAPPPALVTLAVPGGTVLPPAWRRV